MTDDELRDALHERITRAAALPDPRLRAAVARILRDALDALDSLEDT